MARGNTRWHFVGVDVSATTLHVAIEHKSSAKKGKVLVFPNDPAGHKRLTAAITKRGASARVVLEATGTYHVDLSCELALHPHCEVMIVDPRVAKHFHAAQNKRAKTDSVDAKSLLKFGQCMEYVSWEAPSETALQLRGMARYVDQCIKNQTRASNQLHAGTATSTTPEWVIARLGEDLLNLAAVIKDGQKQLLMLARLTPELKKSLDFLDSMPGIAPATAVRLLAEFLFAPQEMTGKQITAWAGLDPQPKESGGSRKTSKRRISKRGNARVRRLLYMPALTAIRKEGPLRDLKERVAERSGVKMVGVGAVMRKMLVIAWAIYRTQQAWDESKVGPKKVA